MRFVTRKEYITALSMPFAIAISSRTQGDAGSFGFFGAFVFVLNEKDYLI